MRTDVDSLSAKSLSRSRLLRLMAGVATTVIATTSSYAAGDGVLGWEWDGVYYASAEEACRAQWQWSGMDNGRSRFIGSTSRADTWTIQDCQWTSYQWLAPEEANCGVFTCGTVLPAWVYFSCDAGYTATTIGRCVRPEDLRPERPICQWDNGGKSNPRTDNPVVLATGAKILTKLDYESADGRFKIRRNYRSLPAGATSSFNQYPLGLARGWQFDFAMEVQLGAFSGSLSSTPTGNVTVIAPDGSGYDFVLTSSGAFEARTASGAVSHDYRLEYVGTLPSALGDIYNNSTEWEVTGPDDRVWTIETFARVNRAADGYRIGRPTSIEQLDGYDWALAYQADGALDTITDTFGRTASFDWYDFFVTSATGVANTDPIPEAVRSITFPDGSKVEYQYDPAPSLTAPSTGKIARLTGVSVLDAANVERDSTAYLYENTDFTFAVTGVVDHRNIRVATYAYDGDGRAVLTQGADGENEYAISYGTAGSNVLREVTNPLGRETIYSFEHVGSSLSDIRLTAVDGEASPNCPASESEVAYGNDGFISETVDEQGRITEYIRDSWGRPLTITEAAGTADQRDTSISWHATWNVPTSIARPGLTTTRAYNGSGQLTTLTETDTTTHTAPYPTNGESRSWAYTYTTGGLVASVDGPLPGTGDTKLYTYDAQGYLATYTDELGHVTTVLSVDDRGNPTSIEDANGVVTNVEFDEIGRIRETTVDPTGIAAVTEVEYDPAGNISKLTEPDGSFLEVEYDANGRVSKITNGLDETVDYAYDPMGNNTSQEFLDYSASLAFKRQDAFDELGRLMETIGEGSATWAYGYDKVGNLTSITDPSNNAAGIAYDSLNRITSYTDERNEETNWAYNDTDAEIATTDPHAVTTSYVRNGWGEAIQEQSNDIGTIVLERNQNGQVVEKTDARNVVTEYAYDDAGRATSTTYPGQSALDVDYSYDATAGGNAGVGRLTSVDDAVGSIAYKYDALGRVTDQTRTIGSQTYDLQMAWNAGGALTELVYPSGRIVTFNRNAAGDVENVLTQETASSSTEGLAWWVAYTPYGPRQGLLHGNELTDWRIYDEDARITSWTVADETAPLEYISRTYDYIDDRNLTAINDGLNPLNTQSFWYTPSGFLQNADGPWGELTFYIDGAGNITHRILDDGSTTTTQNFGIPFDSNRLADETTNNVLTREFTSDAAGNIIAEDDVAASDTSTFTYNHAGQLASVAVNATTKGTYAYDYLSRLSTRTLSSPAGTLHYVHDLDGNIIAEYTSSGTLLREYVWLEERPLAVIDHTGAAPAIYHVHTDHLGRPAMMTDASKTKVWEATYLPFGDVHSVTGSASQTYRFPGQWFQLESGLHYNWHRHYDPSIGRYLQADPLGMPDGPNRWAYALNSPLMNVDPEGRWIWHLIRFGAPHLLRFGPPLLSPPLETPVPAPSPFPPVVPNVPGYCFAPSPLIYTPAPRLSNILTSEGEQRAKPPAGSRPINDTPWSGDHGGIKGAIGAGGKDNVRIDPNGNVWGENTDGSWTNHGPARNFTGSGKPSGQKGKDRDRRW